MSRLVRIVVAASLCASVVAWLGGCPNQEGTTGTGDNGANGTDQTPTPTDAEKDAVAAAAKSAGSLAQAVNTAQSPTGSEDNQSSYELPTFDTTLNFGTCPQVALTASNLGTLLFDMIVDFGDGCQPYGTTDFICSGSGSGSLSQADKRLNMTFENISCESARLSGAVDIGYERLTSAVNVTGTFDLTYSDDAGTIQTNGTGDGSYDLTQYITTVANFEGVVTGTDAYNATMTGLKMCFATYQVFMPYAGELQVSGTAIRTCIVQFDENSPATGIVNVSIGGLPFVPVNVYGTTQ